MENEVMKREPIWYVKNCLIHDFDKWVAECPTRMNCTQDFIEFLIQKNLLSGRRFNRYVDALPELELKELLNTPPCPLVEGFIPQGTWIGKRNNNG